MNTEHLTPSLRTALRNLSTNKGLTADQKNAIYGLIEHLQDQNTELERRVGRSKLDAMHAFNDTTALALPAQAPSDHESVALEMEVYRVALRHIADGCPNPTKFAATMLKIGERP